MIDRISLADGKYVLTNDNGALSVLRHGEPWDRDLIGDNLVYAMLVEILKLQAPIDMVLHCPSCGLQHIDAPDPNRIWVDRGQAYSEPAEWQNPPHRSHLCHGCGNVWRPADVPTNGVEKIKTHGKQDGQIVHRPADGDTSREDFESRVFNDHFIRSIKFKPEKQFAECNSLTKAELLERDLMTGLYVREEISAMWHGFQLARGQAR